MGDVMRDAYLRNTWYSPSREAVARDPIAKDMDPLQGYRHMQARAQVRELLAKQQDERVRAAYQATAGQADVGVSCR
jgi:hypothetical protein